MKNYMKYKAALIIMSIVVVFVSILSSDVSKINAIGGCKIFVKLDAEKHITINVEPTDKVISVKEIIQEKEAIDVNRINLIFAGRILEDDNTLQDYSIQKDSTLILEIKKNAGSFDVYEADGVTLAKSGFTYTADTLEMNESGNYVIDGYGVNVAQQINFKEGFEGVVTLRNVMITHKWAAINVRSTSKVTLLLDGKNHLETNNEYNAALEFNGATSGYLIIDSKTNGSLVAISHHRGSAIGGGDKSDANNIIIQGGYISASANLGAGIGAGEKATYENIEIRGGIVYTKSVQGDGVGNGANGSGSQPIVITGGSIKAEGRKGFAVVPTDVDKNELVLIKLENQENVKSVSVNGRDYNISTNYSNDSGLYFYLKKGEHVIITNTGVENKYNVKIDSDISILLENQWEISPNIKNWVYGSPNNPIGSAKVGSVDFLYCSTIDGTYTNIKPTDAGNYFMKAKVSKTNVYTGLEKIQPFSINKAKSSYSIPTKLSANLNQLLSDVKLPSGFHWVNPNEKMSAIGRQNFEAVYVPKDTRNYEIEKVQIQVNVYQEGSNVPNTADSSDTLKYTIMCCIAMVVLLSLYTREKGAHH